MTILYALVFIASLPVAIPYVLFHALTNAIRERLTKQVVEVTTEGKLATRPATAQDLAGKRIYRMAEAPQHPMP